MHLLSYSEFLITPTFCLPDIRTQTSYRNVISEKNAKFKARWTLHVMNREVLGSSGILIELTLKRLTGLLRHVTRKQGLEKCV